MTRLADALREKFSGPKEALAALGLDENLLADDNELLKAARRARMQGRVKLATDIDAVRGAKEKAMTKPTRFAYHALQMVVPAITPLLAKDAKINLMPVFKDLTTQNFKAKTVKMALDRALRGKLAEDAEPHMGHVAALLDHIEHTVGEPETLDESVSEAQHGAMGAAAGGKSKLGIPKSVGSEFMKADKGKTWDAAAASNLGSYLQDHGLDEDGVRGAMDLLPHVEEEKEEGEHADDAEPGEGVGETDWAQDDERSKAREPGWEHDTPGEDAEGVEESEGEREKDLKTEEAGHRAHEDDKEADDKFPKRGAKDRGHRSAYKRMSGDRHADDKRADDKGPHPRGFDRHADDKRADDKRADDRARGRDKFPKHALDSNMVTKQAMDAAIEAATKATVDRLRGIEKAKAAVRPYVGTLMAFDSAQSADDVYAAALKARDVNIKCIDPSAFPTILGLLPRAGAKEVERGGPQLGMDEERKEKIYERFPGLARIQRA